MADNDPKDGQKADQTLAQGSPEPAIDLNKLREGLRSDISEIVQQHMSTVAKDQTTVEPPAEENPLERILAPAINPHIVRLQRATAAAQDAALFYSSNPDAVNQRDEIEAIFNQMLEQGTPISRQGVYDWLWGKNRKKHIEEAIKRHDEEVAKAKEAADSAPGGRPTPKEFKDASSMTPEELEKALEGVSF